MVFKAQTGWSQRISKSILGSTGTTFKTNEVNLSWTIGEVAISRFTSSNQILEEGFHSGQQSGISTSIHNIEAIVLSLFPNPAKDYVYYKISSPLKNHKLFLYNAIGQIINIPENPRGQIELINIPPGIYTIRIQSQDEKTYIGRFINQ
jgi:hypothetical protein